MMELDGMMELGGELEQLCKLGLVYKLELDRIWLHLHK